MKKKYYIYNMNIKYLNFISIFLLIIGIVPFLFVYHINLNNEFFNNVMLLLIPYFLLHELFHFISYLIHGAKFKNLSFGINLEKGVMCCLCKENISKKNILISLIYPFVFLGIITLIIGIVFNLQVLICLSILNISGCSGDLIMFVHFFKLNNFMYTEFDDPTGFALYTDNDLTNKHFLGLDFKYSKYNLEKSVNKKFAITKISILYLLLYYLIVLLNIVL